jgi:hypothetical protein
MLKRSRLGLAATLDDDRFGRACANEMAAAGVDVGGVRLAPRGPGFFVVEAAGGVPEATRSGSIVLVGIKKIDGGDLP